MSSFNERSVYQTFYSEFPNNATPTLIQLQDWADSIEEFAPPISATLVAFGVDDTELHRSNVVVLAFLFVQGTVPDRARRATRFYVRSGLKDIPVEAPIV